MREKLATQVEHAIVEHIREQRLPAGHHLGAQQLADMLRVSRAPVSAALKELGEAGIVYSEPHRGYFVAKAIGSLPPATPAPPAEEEERLYFRIADDRLSGVLPDRISENELMRRYRVSRSRLQLLLGQIAEEGWVERLPGHGWLFGSTLNSGEAYARAYQFRAVIESQAILQPAFAVDPGALRAARAQQQELLDGAMFTLPRARLFEINATFHETIVSWSNNGFFLDALRRINRLRRLMEYRVGGGRGRLKDQCEEHIALLDMLAAGKKDEAAAFLRAHIDRAWESKDRAMEVAR
ncbi:GntR family transcriptional regulator [Sphingopyxis fribergensis]